MARLDIIIISFTIVLGKLTRFPFTAKAEDIKISHAFRHEYFKRGRLDLLPSVTRVVSAITKKKKLATRRSTDDDEDFEDESLASPASIAASLLMSSHDPSVHEKRMRFEQMPMKINVLRSEYNYLRSENQRLTSVLQAAMFSRKKAADDFFGEAAGEDAGGGGGAGSSSTAHTLALEEQQHAAGHGPTFHPGQHVNINIPSNQHHHQQQQHQHHLASDASSSLVSSWRQVEPNNSEGF